MKSCAYLTIGRDRRYAMADERQQGFVIVALGGLQVRYNLDAGDIPAGKFAVGHDDNGHLVRTFADPDEQHNDADTLAIHQAWHQRFPNIRPKVLTRSTTMSPTVDVDQLLKRLSHDNTPTRTPSWAGVKRRAVEHIVSDSTGAATPNAVFDIGTGWVVNLANEWATSAMPIVGATSITEVDGGRGLPALVTVETPPTAGPQSGEKTDLYSAAFKLSAADTTVIDSTLYLNWSMQLDQTSTSQLGTAMMQAAVAAEADRQVGATIVAEAAAAADLDAALAVFDDGRFLPSVLLVPPSLLSDFQAADLLAAGVRVVMAHIDKPVLLSPSAVTGWLVPLTATAVEPSRLGIGKAYSLYGAVAVDPTGAAAIG